jgi:hypothetical protein
MMRAFITAMLIGLGATSAFGQSGTVAPIDSTSHVGSLLEEWFGGEASESAEISALLEELLALVESLDFQELIDRLSALDFDELGAEIQDLRDELNLYRYGYVGVAEVAVPEDATMPSFWNLSKLCQDTFGEDARLARTSDIAYLLERGELQWDGVERAVFKSSYPIPYKDGLYDTLVSAPVNVDGLAIFDAASDRFVTADSARTATPACSAKAR